MHSNMTSIMTRQFRFIGPRGAVVISQALQNLQSNSVAGGLVHQGFTKMTMLDPHPARNTTPPLYSVVPNNLGLVAAFGLAVFQSQAQDPDPFFAKDTRTKP